MPGIRQDVVGLCVDNERHGVPHGTPCAFQWRLMVGNRLFPGTKGVRFPPLELRDPLSRKLTRLRTVIFQLRISGLSPITPVSSVARHPFRTRVVGGSTPLAGSKGILDGGTRDARALRARVSAVQTRRGPSILSPSSNGSDARLSTWRWWVRFPPGTPVVDPALFTHNVKFARSTATMHRYASGEAASLSSS